MEKPKWWEKPKWDIHSVETLGKRYMCPEIHKGRITIEEYFERDVRYALNKEGIEEVHRITITKK